MSDKKPLRLEWVDPKTLTPNVKNWRRHPQEQMNALGDVLSDVGWAGAVLYNEVTGRLIDGHARREKALERGDEKIPVLIGSWTEEQEAKILATLDPVGMLAAGDAAAYQALVETINADSLWVRDLIHNTSAGMTGVDDQEGDDVDAAQAALMPKMELQPFEHYDYIMLMFRNEQDFQQACERLGIKKVAIEYPGGTTKVGVGRVIDGARAVRLLIGEEKIVTAAKDMSSEALEAGAEAEIVPATKPGRRKRRV